VVEKCLILVFIASYIPKGKNRPTNTLLALQLSMGHTNMIKTNCHASQPRIDLKPRNSEPNSL